MTEDEKLVREYWADVATGERAMRLSSYCAPIVIYPGHNEFADWQHAAEYTREHQRKVDELEADLEWVKEAISMHGRVYDMGCRPRVISRLESILVDLKRGTRWEEKGTAENAAGTGERGKQA